MLDKPYDLAVMFVIFAAIVVTVGFAISDINDYTGNDHNDTYFDTITTRITADTGFKGVADNSAESLSPDEGTGEEASQDSIITQAFGGLVDLGQTWSVMENSLDETVRELSFVPPIYFTLIFGVLVIALVVTIYTWIRGS